MIPAENEPQDAPIVARSVPIPDDLLFLDVATLAKALCVDRDSVTNWVKSGLIVPRVHAKDGIHIRYLFPLCEIRRFLDDYMPLRTVLLSDDFVPKSAKHRRMQAIVRFGALWKSKSGYTYPDGSKPKPKVPGAKPSEQGAKSEAPSAKSED